MIIERFDNAICITSFFYKKNFYRKMHLKNIKALELFKSYKIEYILGFFSCLKCFSVFIIDGSNILCECET